MPASQACAPSTAKDDVALATGRSYSSNKLALTKATRLPHRSTAALATKAPGLAPAIMFTVSEMVAQP